MSDGTGIQARGLVEAETSALGVGSQGDLAEVGPDNIVTGPGVRG